MIRAASLALALLGACTVDVQLEPPPIVTVDAGPAVDGGDRPIPPDATSLMPDGGIDPRDAGAPDAL